MRIVFMGTPDFAAVSLKRLVEDGHEICGVFTQPDKPRNRNKVTFSPVKEYALSQGLTVYQPTKLRDGTALELVKSLAPELIVVVAYGRILPKDILDVPPLGCVNVHASLLPKYRGSAPINWAMLNGDTETGVSIMYMAEELDAGDVILTAKTPIDPEEDLPSLWDRLAKVGAEALAEALPLLAAGTAPRTPQDSTQATFAPMLSRELDTIKPKEGFKSNLILHFLIPALIVIAVTIGTYVIMGSAKTLEAFVLAVTYQAIVLLIQKAFNIREMIQVATEGIKSVVSAMLILSMAYCINAISQTLGTSNYVISVTESWMTPVTLLALAFAVCAFMAFFTGTSWGVYAIMIPIVMPLAFNMTGGEATNLVYATIAAVMGGGCFGDHCSPLSDTTILSSLGAGSDHLAHTKTQLPYALTVAVITCIGYTIIGLCLK